MNRYKFHIKKREGGQFFNDSVVSDYSRDAQLIMEARYDKRIYDVSLLGWETIGGV